MKIAIAAESKDPDAQVSQHASRAPYFLLYDEDGAFLNAVNNPAAEVERGAGPRAAKFLLELGVATLVAGEFGPRLVMELEANNINKVIATGSVSSAIKSVIGR